MGVDEGVSEVQGRDGRQETLRRAQEEEGQKVEKERIQELWQFAARGWGLEGGCRGCPPWEIVLCIWFVLSVHSQYPISIWT